MAIPTNENTICTLAQQWVAAWYIINYKHVVDEVKKAVGVEIQSIPSDRVNGLVRGDEIVVRSLFSYIDENGVDRHEKFYNILKVSETSGFRSIRTVSPWETDDYKKLNVWFRNQVKEAA